jgi:hypothetical protein
MLQEKQLEYASTLVSKVEAHLEVLADKAENLKRRITEDDQAAALDLEEDKFIKYIGLLTAKRETRLREEEKIITKLLRKERLLKEM